MTIDDAPRAPGERVELALGVHTLVATVADVVTLRTATAGPPPAVEPPDRDDLFTGFTFKIDVKDDDEEDEPAPHRPL
jgi:hypothetical protein